MLNTDYFSSLMQIVNQSLDSLYANDQHLFNIKAHERALVFRFGLYFENFKNKTEFKDYDLDIEYNRNFSEPKKIYDDCVLPDLIFHKRGNNNSNLLIIEFKTEWSQEDHDGDFKKLKAFTKFDGEYRYSLGIFTLLKSNRTSVQMTPFKNGYVAHE